MSTIREPLAYHLKIDGLLCLPHVLREARKSAGRRLTVREWLWLFWNCLTRTPTVFNSAAKTVPNSGWFSPPHDREVFWKNQPYPPARKDKPLPPRCVQ
jgi:hypothetical protein